MGRRRRGIARNVVVDLLSVFLIEFEMLLSFVVQFLLDMLKLLCRTKPRDSMMPVRRTDIYRVNRVSLRAESC